MIPIPFRFGCGVPAWGVRPWAGAFFFFVWQETTWRGRRESENGRTGQTFFPFVLGGKERDKPRSISRRGAERRRRGRLGGGKGAHKPETGEERLLRKHQEEVAPDGHPQYFPPTPFPYALRTHHLDFTSAGRHSPLGGGNKLAHVPFFEYRPTSTPSSSPSTIIPEKPKQSARRGGGPAGGGRTLCRCLRRGGLSFR